MLVVFLGWRFFTGGFKLPAASASTVNSIPSVMPSPVNKDAVLQPVSYSQSVIPATPPMPKPVAHEKYEFMDYLVQNFRPRLSISVYSPESGFHGNIDFYDHDQLVERYSIADLHAMGVSVIHRTYGADLVWSGKVYIVTSWKMSSHVVTASIQNKSETTGHPSALKFIQ